MPRFKIHHVTRYTYDVPVRDSANQIILYPIQDDYQEVVKQALTITGDPSVHVYHDFYGNEVGSFTHADPHTELLIDSRIEVVTRVHPQPADDKSKEEQWTELDVLSRQLPYIDFLKQEFCEELAEMQEIAHRSQSRTVTPYVAAQKLNEYIYNNFRYIKGVTSVETTVGEIWRMKAGVCQDFAHILLVMLRMIGIPARYVSGYVCPNHNGMRGEGATHAWVEAYIPFFGWLGLDPTNNCLVNDLHVRLAVGRSFSDCSPVRGTYKGSHRQNLEVGVSVAYEDGNVVHHDEAPAVLAPQPKNGDHAADNSDTNSYRRYMEMIQQQQQQQQ